MIRNKKIVITGGGGFIGTALAERLVDNNEVVLLDTNFNRNVFAFSRLKGHKNIKLAEVDILNASEVAREVKDAEIVVHMAAKLGVHEVIHNASYTLDVNYIGTSNLLKAVSHNSSCERFVFFSTSEVFGSDAFGVVENGSSVLHSIQDARWCYCLSKLAAEHLAFSYFREKGLPAVVIRPFNIFGPRRLGESVIRKFILSALQNNDLTVYGDGTQIRAWCYIDDFCDAVLKTMEIEKAIGEAFNIGNPRNTVTAYEFAKKIISLSDSKSRVVFKKIDFADIDIRVPNTAKARDMLGYIPRIELEEGLSRTIKWFDEHQEELNSVINVNKEGD
jgi:nucleoside-diphosphate-sugar epimerase